MKIKDIEKIRLLLLGSAVVTRALTNADVASMEQVTSGLTMAYTLSVYTGFHLEQLTKDYERIESVYKLIVSNVAELMQCYGIEKDPVKVFAMFVYLYRSGYLSNDKSFMYSLNMKDLPYLCGADVIRGTGVCRSISSMFTDVCQYLGLNASNLGVKVLPKNLQKKEKMSPVDLVSEKTNKTLAKIANVFFTIIPFGNHLVTIINDGQRVGVFDPTNDIYMNMRSFFKYEFINNTGATMSYKTISNVIPCLLGQMKTKVNIFDLYKYSKMEKISYEEYQRSYMEVLTLIKNNPTILESFYLINRDYYECLNYLCNEQHGMIKRIVPFIPSRKK